MAGRILVVIGTRPEAVKLAPVVHALRGEAWAACRVLATAQHRELLDRTLAFFGIVPDRDLDLMRSGQGLADLTACALAGIDRVLAEERPDAVVVQGDTATVLAAALAAFHRQIPLAHVEAGLRTGNLAAPFPEEGNRAMVARLARWHFAPTARAAANLQREGIDGRQVHVVGNTAIDALRWAEARIDAAKWRPQAGARLLLATVHRRENLGAPLAEVCKALLELSGRDDIEILLPVHPNPSVRTTIESLLAGRRRIRLCEPLDYPDMVAAMRASAVILTDSGGVQEEAPALGRPVLVLRAHTERPEAVEAGAARVVGTRADGIVAAATSLLDDRDAYAAMAVVRHPFGSGGSARAIVGVLRQELAPEA
jgi:UDP-N-acetylglucosamine 2-epimerase (non-hydrolysing)